MKKSLQSIVAKSLIVAGLVIPGLAFTGTIASVVMHTINNLKIPAQVSRYYNVQNELKKIQ